MKIERVKAEEGVVGFIYGWYVNDCYMKVIEAQGNL
jgi:hypothetical protein